MRRARFVERGLFFAAPLALCLFAVAALRAGSAAADDKFATFPDVTYVERDGQPLRADILVPQGDGPFPAVLVVHGGAWTAGNKAMMSRVATALAEHGYVTCAINYRLAPKYPFPAQIEDCKAAVRWLRTNADKYKIDTNRIGGFGYSAGGHLVALLGTTDRDSGLEGSDAPADSPSTRIQAVVAGGAPCDFREFPPNNLRLSYWLGGTRTNKPQAYELASPAHFISKDDPPTFFFHGESDALVPLASPRAMQAQLSTAGVPSDLYTVPKAGHIEAFRDPAAIQAGIDFLDKHLKKGLEARD
jgi:triacylglycerol lipase